MHETTARLFAAIEERHPGEAVTSKVAARMNVADNRVTNWKKRGISFEGAVQAEAAFGIPAAWTMYGKMPWKEEKWPFEKWVSRDELGSLSESDLGYVAHSVKSAIRDLQRDHQPKSPAAKTS